jgi:hypothetical protein
MNKREATSTGRTRLSQSQAHHRHVVKQCRRGKHGHAGSERAERPARRALRYLDGLKTSMSQAARLSPKSQRDE